VFTCLCDLTDCANSGKLKLTLTYFDTLNFMKKSTSPIFVLRSSIARRVGLALVAASFLSGAAFADVVYVTSMIQGCTATSVCGPVNNDGTYTEVIINLGVSSTKGSAPGRPTTASACRAD